MTRILSLILLACALPASAQEAPSVGSTASGKFLVDGATLVYNSDAAMGGASPEVANDDVEELLSLLQAHNQVTTLQLTSGGGSVWAGNEMARIVQDFELNTVVAGECSSSCVTIFLAGRAREMTRGSKLGFHQRSWSEEAIQNYYERWREDEDWDNPYEFASWVYEDTQTEIYKELSYMVSRGVSAEFAIETKRLRASMWFPSREELRAAGVLRD